ncbi:MAG: hypothetical protein QOK16_4175 [Solirubrobacteraceae bacterium]|jgi:hypothetical protein|nr:hypothetical protein [Solirubrobacteraceae bacterium]
MGSPDIHPYTTAGKEGTPVILQKIGLPILGFIAGLAGTRAVRVPRERAALVRS